MSFNNLQSEFRKESLLYKKKHWTKKTPNNVKKLSQNINMLKNNRYSIFCLRNCKVDEQA